ncbi:FlgO family outer membrane protein [Desulfurivibrio dismutans]|uniref:FlgO family outer membrane protein n=1 Tax=Desulfurivibrio dismutans TaxID=1398908 RepID=UPI0023D97A5A|nr:FlgO family outer membrane protein [Desulfurivibrio alkaliphilus]MDF1615187.1 FlgO family outer membrane protein [Desulfurivibrio alkaliphilus]
MMTLHKKSLWFMAAGLLLVGPPAVSATAAPPPVAGSAAVTGVPHNHYYYNYPHEIPADYVYRTGRVFSPEELARQAGRFDGADGEPAGPAVAEGRPAKGLTDQAVRALVADLLSSGREELRDGYTLAVSTPVSLRDLYATSSFGRLLGERLLGELQRSGLAVIDVRKTPALLIKDSHGEYGLSRDMDELSFVQEAQAVMVGTYTVTGSRLLVDLRVLRNRDNRVLASARRDFDMSQELSLLLADEESPRRPVAQVPVRDYHQRD